MYNICVVSFTVCCFLNAVYANTLHNVRRRNIVYTNPRSKVSGGFVDYERGRLMIENADKNHFRQHITDVKAYLLRELDS